MVSEHWDLDSVKEFCNTLNISYKVASYQENSELDENIVLAMSPSSGEEIGESDTLRIVLSKKPEDTTTTITTTTSQESQEEN